MTYEFECPDGHVTERDFPMAEAPPLGSLIDCHCGKGSKRVISASTSFCMGITGKHRTQDSSERVYGKEHTAAMRTQRETTEWLTAIGAADGHTGEGKSAWALPTVEGINKKRDMVKAGVKPPESATFGLKSEFVEAIGR